MRQATFIYVAKAGMIWRNSPISYSSFPPFPLAVP